MFGRRNAGSEDTVLANVVGRSLEHNALFSELFNKFNNVWRISRMTCSTHKQPFWEDFLKKKGRADTSIDSME